MKTIIVLFFFIFSNLSYSSTPDSLVCLELHGVIANAHVEGHKNCIVEIISASSHIDSLILKKGKKNFVVNLKKDEKYTIRISRQGYITKVISIDTKQTPVDGGIFRFQFFTQLIDLSSAEKLNKDALSVPIAVIYYDPKKGGFTYDKAYTSRVKRDMRVSGGS